MKSFILVICFLQLLVGKSIAAPSFSTLATVTTTASSDVDENEKKAREDFREMQLESWILNRGSPDERSGINLDKWNASTSMDDPEERGDYLEGDILFEDDPSSPKSAIMGENYRWPNAKVYVKFSNVFTPSDLAVIRSGMKEIEKHTCVKFFDYNPGVAKDYIDISSNHTGCFSSVGRRGGSQRLNLQRPRCINKKTVSHEFIHALGFFHEQSRGDRDKYVQILYKNIKNPNIHNFERRDSNNLGSTYDPESIMHYSRYAFAKNPKLPTINFKPPYQDFNKKVITTKNRKMSSMDIQKINRLYKCEKSGTNGKKIRF
ncbi:low choriolytic enzyme-like [Neocloeon triangulifer]|uniref:low choriolytic enzyme-like n=1 Tax=Neocloeon triangulifer TaxID=2078957 RepID=UPI00286ED8F7|nr:low choriolytic enzyme-like [Neocloeon triangulifer]